MQSTWGKRRFSLNSYFLNLKKGNYIVQWDKKGSWNFGDTKF